jgi:DHA2 family multidrug resistance protein
MLRKKMSPILLSGIGFALFFIFTTMLSHLTLQSGKEDFFWPLIIRGVGLGMIFIPLTTITLVGLNGTEIPQGTAISNMIRNLGGSFGTAIMTTFVSTRSKLYYDNIKNHVSVYDTNTQDRLSMLKNAFIARGQNAFDAEKQAIAALYGSVMKQSMLMTYNDCFMIVGTFFLVCIPMLLLFKKKKKEGEEETEMHIEMIMD